MWKTLSLGFLLYVFKPKLMQRSNIRRTFNWDLNLPFNHTLYPLPPPWLPCFPPANNLCLFVVCFISLMNDCICEFEAAKAVTQQGGGFKQCIDYWRSILYLVCNESAVYNTTINHCRGTGKKMSKSTPPPTTLSLMTAEPMKEPPRIRTHTIAYIIKGNKLMQWQVRSQNDVFVCLLLIFQHFWLTLIHVIPL